MREFSLQQVNRYTLGKQHLTVATQADDVVQIAQDVAGLHATGAIEPYLAAFARGNSFARQQLDNALTIDRSLVKMRYVRSTLYLLTRAMVPIAFTAMHSFIEKLSQRYLVGMGNSPAEYTRIFHKILQFLQDGPRSIAQIKSSVGGVLHLPSIINLMCDQGLLARVHIAGNWKARIYQYALFASYYPDIDLQQYTEQEAISLLLERYIRAFSPVTEEDIFWWVGLPRNRIRPVLDDLQSQLVELRITGIEGTSLMFKDEIDILKKISPSRMSTVNVLPTLDPYLMGYKQRSRYLDYRHFNYIFDRSGNVTTTVLVNGKITGIWDIDDTTVKLFLLEKVSRQTVDLVHTRLEEMGRFITGGQVKIQPVKTMTPLTVRTAGGFMTPLKQSE